MSCISRTSKEQTIALQGVSRLTVGDRYYVETDDADFIGFLAFQRGPLIKFLVDDEELTVGPLDIRSIKRL